MPEQAPTLRDMIKDANDRGLTYEQLAKNAVDPQTGHKTSAGYINDIARGRINRLPETKNLRAIAAGLRVAYERVRQAAINEWLPPDGADAGTDAELIEYARQLRDRHLEEAAKAAAALARLEGRDTESAAS